VLKGSLPEGFFAISAKAQFDLTADAPSTSVSCTLTLLDATSAVVLPGDASKASLAVGGIATLPFSTVGDLPPDWSAVLHCVGDNVSASNVKLTAIQVGSLTFP